MRLIILSTLSFAVLTLTGCGGSDVQPAAEGTQAAEVTSPISIEGGVSGDQSFITFEAMAEIDGRKPRFAISCKDGVAQSFSIDAVREPQSPPPLAGVIGSFFFDSAEPITVEMGWSPPSRWAVRNDDNASAMIARSFLNSEWAAFSVAEPHGFDEIEWVIQPTSEVADYLTETCGAPKRAKRP